MVKNLWHDVLQYEQKPKRSKRKSRETDYYTENYTEAERIPQHGTHGFCPSQGYAAPPAAKQYPSQGYPMPSAGGAYPSQGSSFAPAGRQQPSQGYSFAPAECHYPSQGHPFAPAGCQQPSQGHFVSHAGACFPPQGYPAATAAPAGSYTSLLADAMTPAGSFAMQGHAASSTGFAVPLIPPETHSPPPPHTGKQCLKWCLFLSMLVPCP